MYAKVLARWIGVHGLVAVLLLVPGCAVGQGAQPGTASPSSASGKYQVPIPESFAAAVQRGTRTFTGRPGPRYWQQWAEYRLEAELNPIAKRLTGRGRAIYHNRSPDTLPAVYVHLYDNLFAPESERNTNVLWAIEGVTVTRVVAQGELRAAGNGYTIDGTVMRIDLPRPLLPGDTAGFEFAWQLRVPPDGSPRGGQDGEVWFLSYWYPQFAVYDDLNGWQVDQYYGNAEFYMGYGSYDVALTLPAGWLVTATGELRNPAEVLGDETRARLDLVAGSDTVIHVVADADLAGGRVTRDAADGRLTWRFHADSVRDVAWAASERYLWDAVRAVTGSDTTDIYAFYRPEQRQSYWDRNAHYGRHAIEWYSRQLWPYPYPHMALVDGPKSCGGMEFPMMTCIGGQWDAGRMYEVATHEIAHEWFPMVVGSDEKRYAWMDEGFTQFNQSAAIDDLFPATNDAVKNRDNYLSYTRRRDETALMHHGDRYPSYGAYGVASYFKPAAVLASLRGVVGDSVFAQAFREYGRRWRFRHPSPLDFFHTVDDVAGRDLGWFWRSWFYETWTLDQAIESVRAEGDSVAIVIRNRERAVMPVPLEITRAGGAVERLTLPVDVWLDGARKTTLTLPREPAVTRVVIDPDHQYPDVNRDNQLWPRR